MISTKDKLLIDCYPSDNITWNEFMRDCEKAVNTPELHLNKCSSDNEDLARDKRNNNKRGERILNMNSVVKVLDKKWRSTRVC